jgi:mono/diheme cytochrome c family protein
MIKPLILISAVVLLIPAPAQPLPDTASTLAQAKALYLRDCVMCHGANGDGKTDIAKDRQLIVADWTDPKSLSAKPDQQLFNIIRNGLGKMPAESAGRANDDEVNALIQYIRSMGTDNPASPTSKKD